jgi:saccharopine dehydrogenase-like NADP-dependent oxidoreductase
MRGFAKAWDVLVKLGMTDDMAQMDTTGLTLKTFTASFIPKSFKSLASYITSLPGYEKDRSVLKKINWLELESAEPLIPGFHSPASVLLERLRQKWKLLPGDLDRIVMIHYIEYVDRKGKKKSARAILDVKGDDEIYTAMSKTVGLPMAIAARLILNGKISGKGIVMPLQPEIYIPVLKELEKQGIAFSHS